LKGLMIAVTSFIDLPRAETPVPPINRRMAGRTNRLRRPLFFETHDADRTEWIGTQHSTRPGSSRN
jgi:hypothetical protein